MQRILIVEDDIEIQDMLRNYLTDAGYEVVPCFGWCNWDCKVLTIVI